MDEMNLDDLFSDATPVVKTWKVRGGSYRTQGVRSIIPATEGSVVSSVGLLKETKGFVNIGGRHGQRGWVSSHGG